jgi:hypothetical protein
LVEGCVRINYPFSLGRLLGACVRGFLAFHLPDELASFLGEIAPLIQGVSGGRDEWTRLCALASLAEGWYACGPGELARPVISRALDLLPSLAPRPAGWLACATAGAVRTAPAEEARACYQAVLERTSAPDTYTTSTHYGLTQLEVIDAIVLSAVEAFLND